MIYNITSEPEGTSYINFLQFVSRISSSFLFVKRKTINLSNGGKELIRTLQPHKLSETESQSWPGTQLLNGKTAVVFRFSATQQTLDILLRSSDRLFAWQQPTLPEDLCFEDQNQKPLLTTISHEADARLSLSVGDYARFQREVPSIRLEAAIKIWP